MNQIYLTRRNLTTLLQKLDAVREGRESHLTLIKSDTSHRQFPCTTPTIVIAVEDEVYYTDRKPGEVKKC